MRVWLPPPKSPSARRSSHLTRNASALNADVRDYTPWTPNALLFNNWTADGGMEPIILRYKGTATGGSSTTIVNDAGATTSAEEAIADGFFDDAEVRVYRVVDARVRLLRTNRVLRYLASAASGYALVLDEEGPPVQAGDLYFLTLLRDDAPVDKVHPRLADLATADTWQISGRPRLRHHAPRYRHSRARAWQSHQPAHHQHLATARAASSRPSRETPARASSMPSITTAHIA